MVHGLKSVEVEKVYDQIISIGCRHVEVRVYDKLTGTE